MSAETSPGTQPSVLRPAEAAAAPAVQQSAASEEQRRHKEDLLRFLEELQSVQSAASGDHSAC